MAQLEFQFARDADGRLQVRKTVQDYALAIALVAASSFAQLSIGSAWRHQLAFLGFFPAIIIAVAFLRKGPALFTIVTSLVLANWLCFPSSPFSFARPSRDWIDSILFLLAGLALLFFSERGRRALLREESIVKTMEAKSLELAASEEFNRRMLASIPDSVKVLDFDGFLLSINDTGKRLLEIDDQSAWLRRNWLETWPEEHREMVRGSVQRAKAGQVALFTARRPTAKGTMRWWEVVLSPICDRHGYPERLLAISRDVTERHVNELRRLESEERRRLAIAATDDAIWDLDVANDRFTVNESYQRHYGCPADEHWRQWFLKRIHPDDQRRVEGALTIALEGTTQNWVSEYRFLRFDGTWGHVLDRAYISRDASGRPRRVVGAMMNLLPLRKAEWRAELLAETSSLLLQADSPEAVVNSLCEKVLVFLNCDAYFNFLLDETTGQLRVNACGGCYRDRLEVGQVVDNTTVCGCVAQSGLPIVVEDVQRSADPRADLVRALGIQAYACNPLVARGRTVGTLSFGTKSRTRFEQEELALMKAVADQVAIAMERQKTQAELRTMNEELEARVGQRTESLAKTTEQLNSFCYSVAHDLRAPLRTQTGFARLLLDDYSDRLDETGRYYLKAIMQAAERQGNIIQDLMAHVNVSRADLTMESIDLHTAVQQAKSDLEVELQQKGTVVDTSQLDGDLVLANRSSLHLVLLNLLSNASKFVPPGTKPVVKVRSESREGAVRLWVEDNGIGIDPGDHKRLFGMFQRLKKGDYPGTGMGLAIVKTAVERMGGCVGVESEPGKGSRFWVELKKLPVKNARAHFEPKLAQLVN